MPGYADKFYDDVAQEVKDIRDAHIREALADEFSTSNAYAAGDYVIYEGELWKFTSAHIAGAWNSSHAAKVQVCEDVTDIKTLVDIMASNLQPRGFGYLKELLDIGLAPTYLPVGTQLIDKWSKDASTEYECPLDVVHYDSQGNAYLQWHWSIPDNVAFDAPEAIYYAGNDGLPAGTYHIDIGYNYGDGWSTSKSIQFTLAVALEKDDQIFIDCGTNQNTDPTNGITLKTFAKGSTTAKETTTTSNGTGGTLLGSTNSTSASNTNGQINSPQRVVYGYGRWSQSAVRQYFNSSGAVGEWWSAQNPWDRPVAQAATLRGFLAGCSEDFLSILEPVSVVTALNTAEGLSDEYETTQDKIFLSSLQEMYVATQLADVEGEDWDYYKDLAQELGLQGRFQTGSSNVYPELKTYSIANHSSAMNARLRSCGRGYANGAWYVYSSGYVTSNGAYYAVGGAPACKILKSV